MKNETWEPLRDNKSYSLSSMGRIRNEETHKVLKVIKTFDGKLNRASVNLMYEGVQRSRVYGRLVMGHRMGLDLSSKYWIVEYIDGDQWNATEDNYKVSNPKRRAFKWCTNYDETLLRRVTKFPKTENLITISKELNIQINHLYRMRRKYITINGRLQRK